jgi:mRNA interferase MazF
MVGTADGLRHESVVNLDHVQTVEQARLVKRLGQVSAETMRNVCRALAIAVGCAD